MKKVVKKVFLGMSLLTILSANTVGLVSLPFLENNQIVSADTRYVIMSRTLSQQQVRDWASAIRMAEKGGSVSGTVLGYLANLALPGAGKIFALSGFLKPAYFSKVKQAADQGKRIKLVVTDSKT